MKTQEQKLQHVMESAGECWHVQSARTDKGTHKRWCTKCHKALNPYIELNPSPGDLNELSRLSENLGWTTIESSKHDKVYTANIQINGHWDTWQGAHGETRTEALLNALYLATGGKDVNKN